MNSKVVVCGLDTSKIPKLKPEQLASLMNRLKAGDEKAKQEFIYHNYRLVLNITHRFNPKNTTADDLFQVGVIGLIKAINNFDTSYNLKFSTYAVPMICGEIKRYLRDNSLLRVSRSIKDMAYLVLKTKEKMQKTGIEPSLEDVAKHLKLPLKSVVFAVESGNDPAYLFEKTMDENKGFLLDELEDSKESYESRLEQMALSDALKKLDEREKLIVDKRYFEGKTQNEVSNEIGISQAQVSRLEKNALRELEQNL